VCTVRYPRNLVRFLGLNLSKNSPSKTIPETSTLVVQVPEGDAEVWIDGESRGVVGPSKTARLVVRPGKHTVSFKQGEEELFVEAFALDRSGELTIDAKWLRGPSPTALEGLFLCRAYPAFVTAAPTSFARTPNARLPDPASLEIPTSAAFAPSLRQ
jgi:hypothetical protein